MVLLLFRLFFLVLLKFITFADSVFISKAVIHRRQVYLSLLLLLLFLCSALHTQGIQVKRDSLRLQTGTATGLKTDSLTPDPNKTIPLRLTHFNPAENPELQQPFRSTHDAVDEHAL